MWASFSTSRADDSCIKGCQNSCFSNTQDILNIVTGNLLENEQDGEPVILHDQSKCSANFLNINVREGTNPRVFQTGSSLLACSTTSPTTGVKKVRGKCLDCAKGVATCAARLSLGDLGVSVVQVIGTGFEIQLSSSQLLATNSLP